MNKIIWITGAGSGIGKALALAYNNPNNTIVLSGRNVDQLQEVASQLHSSLVLPLDVTDENAIETAVTKVNQESMVK